MIAFCRSLSELQEWARKTAETLERESAVGRGYAEAMEFVGNLSRFQLCDLQNLAARWADELAATYVSSGRIRFLGASMAYQDIACSVVDRGVEVPAYQASFLEQ